MALLTYPTASLAIRPASLAEIPTLRALAERIWRASYATLLSAGQIDYMLERWQGLMAFLDDGRIEPDSNTVERSIRPIASGK